MSETVSGYSAFLTFILGIVTLITLALGVLQWRTRQMIRSAVFKETTVSELAGLEKQIKEICDKLERVGNHAEALGQLERRLTNETDRAKDEHIRMEKNQLIIQEDVKQAIAEINKLIGRLDASVPK